MTTAAVLTPMRRPQSTPPAARYVISRRKGARVNIDYHVAYSSHSSIRVWKHETISVTTSIGVATGTDSTDLDQVLHNADLALYRAKAEGRNRVVGL